MTDTADLDENLLRAWIGREDTGSERIAEDLVRRFRASLDVAPGSPDADHPAPRMLHWCLALPVVPTAALGPDGHPERGGFLPPVPLPRRMWAGGDVTFHADLRSGDTVRRVSRIADVAIKAGRTGTLCFVTVHHRFEAEGRLAITETQDIVYRGPDSGTVRTPPPAPHGAWRRAVEPAPPLLFRYSALTFNSHRIHYDEPYATGVEGYAGLVVHGPLQATLLAHFAHEIHGAPPRRFSFRGQSPAFHTAPLVLNAQAEGDGLRLWTATDGGPVAMSAYAQW